VSNFQTESRQIFEGGGKIEGMANELHDNIKSFLVSRLWETNRYAWTTELKIEGKRIDIANRNLRFLIEVEPTVRDVDSGDKQLRDYISLSTSKGIKDLIGVLCYHKNAKTRTDFFSGNPEEIAFRVYKVIDGNVVEVQEVDFDRFLELALQSVEEKPLFSPTVLSFRLYAFKDETYSELADIFRRHKGEIESLYKAYEIEIKKVFPEITEEKAEEFYLLHTYLNTTALCLIYYIMKQGEIESVEDLKQVHKGYSLPFLNWWFVLYRKGSLEEAEKKFIDEWLKSLYFIVSSFKYEVDMSDVFRLLYEELISEEDRRKLGEYYTPTWFVKWCLDQLGQDVIEKPFIDPCCGTGTFLVEAFKRKVHAGKDPDTALSEVLGFDINPLAVVLARAELYIAYRLSSGKSNRAIPFVFYSDTSLDFHQRLELIKKLGSKEDYINEVQTFTIQKPDYLNKLPLLENLLESLLDEIDRNLKQGRYKNNEQLRQDLLEGLKRIEEGGFTNLTSLVNYSKLAQELWNYGNGIWALLITSLLARYITSRLMKGSYVIGTNPPWITLSKLSGAYGNVIRKAVKGMGAERQMIQGGDIASYFLCKWVSNSSVKGVFVMPSSAVYTGTYGSGYLITYRCLRHKNADFYVFKTDVFKHGILPGVVVVGKGQKVGSGEEKTYYISLRRSYGKDQKDYDLQDFVIEKEENISQKAQILLQVLRNRDYGIRAIADKVRVKGVYIMGLKGGEQKRGAVRHSGLLLDYYNPHTGYGKLINLDEEIFLHIRPDFAKSYLKKVFYADRVLPFKLLEPYMAILSGKGENNLKEFLRELANRVNRQDSKQKLYIASQKVKQGSLEFLKKGKFYLMHRVIRAFSSAVFECPEDNLYVIDSTLCYVEFSEKEPAYYYCGVINSLLYFARQLHIARQEFNRNQHSRVLQAVDLLGCPYSGDDWQLEIAKLSENLHSMNIEGNSNREVLMHLQGEQTFQELIKIFNSHVSKDRLEKAISLLRS